MVLRAPGMLALHIALDQVEAAARVSVSGKMVSAYDMGPIAAQWFSDFLRVKARLVRFDPEEKRPSELDWTGGVEALNQFSDGYPLLVTSEASLTCLNDKLVAVGADPVAMARFRPNVVLSNASAAGSRADEASVSPALMAPHDEDRLDELQVSTPQGLVRLRPVKPCPRCPIVNIDPLTAASSPEVNDMLQTYRQDPRLQGAPSFGMNVIVVSGVDHLLKVGQPVNANYRFDD